MAKTSTTKHPLNQQDSLRTGPTRSHGGSSARAARELVLSGVGAIPSHSAEAPTLDAHEWSRKLCHIAPGFLAFLLPSIPHDRYMSLPLTLSCLAIAAGLSFAALFCKADITRPGEKSFRTAVLGYAAVALGTFLVFPHRLEIGLTTLAVLAFGDGTASLGGMLFKGPSLPWNPRKTVAGFLSFLVFAVPAATWVWWAETKPEGSWHVAFGIALFASLAAAIAESLPSKISDNIRVGAAAAAALALVDAAHSLLAGS